MIYLVGCKHNLQTYNAASKYFPKAQAAFRAFIENAILANNISLVAEELADPFEPDVSRPERGSRSSVAWNLVNDLKRTMVIEHRYCEPSPADKSLRGIGGGFPFIEEPCDRDFKDLIHSDREAHLHDIAHRWPVREKFWIERLGSDLHQQVLFICGALHRCTLGNRLRAIGVETKVIVKLFQYDQGLLRSHVSAAEFAAYKQVRRHGFPPEMGCPCVTPGSIR